MVVAMEEAVFEDIGVYIKKRQNTVAQYIVTQPILDLEELDASDEDPGTGGGITKGIRFF